MDKDCRSCEFNFNGICCGSSDLYHYGEVITDETKCCTGWGANFQYFEHQTTTAPRFLRDAHTECRISYQEFSKLVDDYDAGKAVPINIFDALKAVYGISMVDIAIVLGITFGVVYRAKTQGFAKKRLAQFANGLCLPERLLLSTTTEDFDELSKCKRAFFAKPGMATVLESMPDWKMELAQAISSDFVHCPIHIAKTLARVDHLYWNKAFPMEAYTESEKLFIKYIAKGTRKYEPVHNLEYFLDIGCRPHMRTSMLLRDGMFH